MAPIHPKVWMSFWIAGANTNCPNEPPALIHPEAAPRSCGDRRCDAAPIRTEKLQAPAPAAANTPSVRVSPAVESIQGVRKEPSVITSNPASKTGRGPQ